MCSSDLDTAQTAHAIEQAIRQQVQSLHRRGIVVGLSGGIDSSVVTSLCARAVGAERVQVLFMPERDSSSESLTLGRLLTDKLGVPTVLEELAPILAAAGCYDKQIEAIRKGQEAAQTLNGGGQPSGNVETMSMNDLADLYIKDPAAADAMFSKMRASGLIG